VLPLWLPRRIAMPDEAKQNENEDGNVLGGMPSSPPDHSYVLNQMLVGCNASEKRSANWAGFLR
jgi:hypothetical protein